LPAWWIRRHGFVRSPATVGSAVFTLTVQINGAVTPNTLISNTATASAQTTDLNTGNQSGSAETTVGNRAPATVSATKTASGTFLPGSTVTYTVVLSNAGPGDQFDQGGDEFTDVLPSQLTSVAAGATRHGRGHPGHQYGHLERRDCRRRPGRMDHPATLASALQPGSTVSNQGSFAFDADGNGTNEAAGVTDDLGPARRTTPLPSSSPRSRWWRSRCSTGWPGGARGAARGGAAGAARRPIPMAGRGVAVVTGAWHRRGDGARSMPTVGSWCCARRADRLAEVAVPLGARACR
jgi:uncharacterized repeat protein (TIGR01451 family)